MSGKLLLAFNFSLLVATALSATKESNSVPQPTQPPAAGSSTDLRPTTTVNALTTQAPATPGCDSLEAEPCCNTTGCGFYSCISITNATLNHTGCHAVGDKASFCAVNIPENTCRPPATAAPTTLAPPATVKTENPVTSAEPVDPCEGLSNQAECCSSPSACSYIKCIDLKDQPHEGCHKNTTVFSEICKANQPDLCSAGTTAKPTTTLQPAPTTAEGTTQGGSTKADNASTTVSSGNQNAQSGDKERTQSFDAPSFVGGMVLVAGLVGIIFFGLKFYKARTERNYHTL